MARQRKTAGELASILHLTPHTVGRRLSGAVPFDVAELLAVGDWLGIDAASWLTAPVDKAAS